MNFRSDWLNCFQWNLRHSTKFYLFCRHHQEAKVSTLAMTTWDDFTAMVTAGVDPTEMTQHTSQVLNLIQKSVKNAHQPRSSHRLDGQTEQPAHPVTALWHSIRTGNGAAKTAIPFMRLSPRTWQILSENENDPTIHRLEEERKNHGIDKSCHGQVFDKENEIDLLSLFDALPTDPPIPHSECHQFLHSSSHSRSYDSTAACSKRNAVDATDASGGFQPVGHSQLQTWARLFAGHVRNVADTLSNTHIDMMTSHRRFDTFDLTAELDMAQWSYLVSGAIEFGGSRIRKAYRTSSVIHTLLETVPYTNFARVALYVVVPSCLIHLLNQGATTTTSSSLTPPQNVTETKRYTEFCHLAEAVSDAAQVDQMKAGDISELMTIYSNMDSGIFGSAAQVIIAKKLFPQ